MRKTLIGARSRGALAWATRKAPMRNSLIALIVGAALFVGCGEADRKGAADVEGLNLSEARRIAKQQGGFEITVREDDAAFGVVIEENFVVCKQHDTKGKLVPVDVAKHGC